MQSPHLLVPVTQPNREDYVFLLTPSGHSANCTTPLLLKLRPVYREMTFYTSNRNTQYALNMILSRFDKRFL